MIKWLDFFSIKQKLAILLLFLLSAVSYISIDTMLDANQHKKSTLKIEIAQQQHLIVERFINAHFLSIHHSNLTGEKSDKSEIKKNQFLFEQNLKTLLYGGKTYLDLTKQDSIYLASVTNGAIKIEIKESQQLWKNLQSASQNLSLQSINHDQINVFHYLSEQLHSKLSSVVNALKKKHDENLQQDLLTLQLSWLFILIIGTLFAGLIARNITQPLDDIAKAASRIRLGDLQSYAEHNSHHDELGTLLYQTDEMRLVLSDLILNIQQYNKQMLHSSHEAQHLSQETNSLQHLQYNQHNNVSTQLTALQQHSQTHLKQLIKQSNHQNESQLLIDECSQSKLENIKLIEQIQSSHKISIENWATLQQIEAQLYERVSQLEHVAINTQELVRKASSDTTQVDIKHDKFTRFAIQMTHITTKTASDIAEITPLIKQLKTQLNRLSMPLKDTEQQLYSAHQQLSQSNLLIDSIKSESKKQQDNGHELRLKGELQLTKISSIQRSLQDSFTLIEESSAKVDASNLFLQDLNKIALQLEKLSHDFKLDKKENRARKGNDKRFYPRIDNQLKISLQQAGQTLHGLTQDLSLSGLQLKSMQSVKFNHRTPVIFNINLPNDDLAEKEHTIELLGDVVHYEQQQDNFYYGVRFHKLNTQDKAQLEQIFKYFEKKSEYKKLLIIYH